MNDLHLWTDQETRQLKRDLALERQREKDMAAKKRTTLKGATTEELQEELDRRRNNPPTPRRRPNWQPVLELLGDYVDKCVTGQMHESTFQRAAIAVFSRALAAVYGEEAPAWWQRHMVPAPLPEPSEDD